MSRRVSRTQLLDLLNVGQYLDGFGVRVRVTIVIAIANEIATGIAFVAMVRWVDDGRALTSVRRRHRMTPINNGATELCRSNWPVLADAPR